jgi:hypothetical protein
LITAVGMVFYKRAPKLIKATPAQIAFARADIEAQFKTSETTCVGDNLDAAKREQVFDAYLKVNQYANRAVMRSCNNQDSLLALTADGWQKTSVNMALDARVNPVWQKACLIDDITFADDQARPENSSIDSVNLEQCNYLRLHNKVKPFQRY